jgi:GntR family transcriptional regulator/MocR family aminotransferase
MADLHLRVDRAAGNLAGQVAAEVRTGVRDGRLVAGTRLPASRELARDLGVSRGVVVAAYEQLVAEGFLISRQGDGTRVAGSAAAGVARSARGAAVTGEKVRYDLRPGAPDLSGFPRDRWLAAVRSVLRRLPHAAFDYPDPAGVAELRIALAAYLGRVRAAIVPPECVIVTAGVAQGLVLAVRALMDTGRTTLAVEDPTSHRQLPLLVGTGARIVRIPVDEHGIDVEALAASGARAVLVTPAHQYPTGVVLSPARRAALVAWARAADGVVIEDDYDAEFRYDREPVGCVQGLDPGRVMLTGSTSKALAPGLRLGWLAVPGSFAGRLGQMRADLDLGSPVIDQHALVEFIDSGSYDRHLRLMRRTYRAHRDALANALEQHVPGVRIHGVAAGLHLYVELPGTRPEAEVVADAARLGVAVQGAAPMWTARAPGPALVLGHSRVAPPRLAEAAELLGKAVLGG